MKPLPERRNPSLMPFLAGYGVGGAVMSTVFTVIIHCRPHPLFVLTLMALCLVVIPNVYIRTAGKPLPSLERKEDEQKTQNHQ